MSLVKNRDNFAQTNIFTFDQDDQQQIQWQQPSTHQQGMNITTNNNSKDSNQQNTQNQPQIFVFDQQSQSESQQEKDQQQQVEQFAYIKNKILFKEKDNYVNVNGLIGDYENCGSKAQDAWIKNRQPKPETLTKRFENKVREVRKSLSGEQIQLDLRKVQSQIDKSNTPSRFEKQAKLERRSLMNNLGIQKENKHNDDDKSNSTMSHTSKNIKSRGSFFKQPIAPPKSNFIPPTPTISLTPPPQLEGAKVTLPPSSQFHYVQQQKALKVTNMKQFLFTQLSQEYKVNLLITKCSSEGFLSKMINGVKYFVTIEENGKFLFSVVKDGLSRFVFSMNKEDCTEKNKGYLGQMKGEGLDKTAFVMYDYGFDPKQTKCLEYSYKQLASIKYEQSSGPRKFSVILSTNNMGFSSIEDDVNILEKKWSSSKDRKHLAKVYSKEPQLDQTDGNYKLDFKGMMGKPSIKNFVLSSQEYEDCLIFARRNEDTYAVEVRNPFSLVQAVAVCMSSIYHKSLF